ncbi:SCO4848 family membrane protein [Nocardioides perillae]|uniref:Uncharacterized protein n=1 Tax=Nocardioides perillae TaxID=1119534 RepID=A0A7Y9RTL6_9ACTN|nr:hypothetical protein [Nocardioides perillae]NYG55099.1 hypothetical protein [Nocardioides perillae]
MTWTRKQAVLVLAVAAFTALSFANFAATLYDAWSGGEDRPPGYYAAHSVLIVVNLAIAAALGTLGARAWRATRR